MVSSSFSFAFGPSLNCDFMTRTSNHFQKAA
jgi:hypothetical protein